MIYDEVQQIIATDTPRHRFFHGNQAMFAKAGLRGWQVHPTETNRIRHETGFKE